MIRILVTGVKGFIGSHVLAHLTATHPDAKIYGIGREWEYKVPYVDYIIHCGAAAGPWHTPLEIHDDNVVRMFNLIQFALCCPRLKGFVFLSSMSIYGQIPDGEVVDESTPIRDPDLYGISKLYGERLLKSYDIPSVSLRLPGMIGAGVRGYNFLPRLARRIRDRKLVSVFNLNRLFNNVVHVQGLCEVIDQLLSRDFGTHESFVLSSIGEMPMREVIAVLGEAMEREVDLDDLGRSPGFLINADKARDHKLLLPTTTLRQMLIKFASEILDEPTS